MDFIIRRAKLCDVKSICEIISQMTPGLPHDYRQADLKFLKINEKPDYYIWVAEKNNVVVGTCMMHIQHKLSYHCGCAAHLEDVVVDFQFRGQGIGQALVEEAVNTAKELGAYKIMLTCYEKTIPFYENLGFKKHDYGMRMSLMENEHPMVGEN